MVEFLFVDDESAPMEQKRSTELEQLFQPIHKVTDCLFFHFEKDKPCWKRWLSGLLVLCTTTIDVYTVFFLLYMLSTRSHTSEEYLSALTVISWALSCLTGTVFMVKLFHSKRMYAFFDVLYEVNGGIGIRQNVKGMRLLNIFFLMSIIASASYCTALIVLDVRGYRPRRTNDDPFNIFYLDELHPVVSFCMGYNLVVWHASFHVCCFCIQAAVYELEAYNECLATIGSSDEAHTLIQIERALRTNRRFVAAIRVLDDMLKKFSFFTVVMSIPAILFTLFLSISKRNQPIGEIAVTWPTIYFCFYSYLCITIFPARLHETSNKSRSIFCMNMRTWLPYRQSVYIAASAFSSHLAQTDLGVSIWGFAVLSKPLILTTLSVMITCLALLLQFKDYSKESL